MVWQVLAALLIVSAVIVSGCGAAPAAAPVAEARALESLPATIDAATANQRAGRDDVVVVDVREADEFASGHVPGATWIPLGELPARLNELPRDKTVVAVCRSGNRSGQATQLLRQNGFQAHNMAGGMIAWEQAGYAIER
jgi:rhodanese-related sulfurtransferase